MRTLLAAFLFLPLIASAAGGSEFVGRWVNVKYKSARIEVTENGSNFVITELQDDRSRKYVAKLSDGMLTLDAAGALNVGIEKASGHLLYGGSEYRRLKDGESFDYTPAKMPKW